jgi:hypothetical protein
VYPIIGSEALANGDLTRGQLRWNYEAVHPDVYVTKDHARTLDLNTCAAWLWSKRTGIVAGRAAAAIHGVRSLDASTPIEMIGRHARRRRGIVMRDERIMDDEWQWCSGMRMTTAARTALDIGRHLPRDLAVEYLDELAQRTRLAKADVAPLLERYRGARGLPSARIALSLMDGGARCREETRIRLLLHDAGFPKPRTGILVCDGTQMTRIGLGWDSAMVGVSFVAETTLAGSLLVQELRHRSLLQRQGWIEFGFASLLHARTQLAAVRDELRKRRR